MPVPRERQDDRRGTTSDPNQSNRQPARDKGAEQPREAPIGPRPEGDDDDA